MQVIEKLLFKKLLNLVLTVIEDNTFFRSLNFETWQKFKLDELMERVQMGFIFSNISNCKKVV